MIFSIPVLSNLCSQIKSFHMQLISCQNYFYPMNLVACTQKRIGCDVPWGLSEQFVLTFVLMWHCYALKLHHNFIHFFWPHTKFPFLLTRDSIWASTDAPITENAEYLIWHSVRCFHAGLALIILLLKSTVNYLNPKKEYKKKNQKSLKPPLGKNNSLH